MAGLRCIAMVSSEASTEEAITDSIMVVIRAVTAEEEGIMEVTVADMAEVTAEAAISPRGGTTEALFNQLSASK